VTVADFCCARAMHGWPPDPSRSKIVTRTVEAVSSTWTPSPMEQGGGPEKYVKVRLLPSAEVT